MAVSVLLEHLHLHEHLRLQLLSEDEAHLDNLERDGHAAAAGLEGDGFDTGVGLLRCSVAASGRSDMWGNPSGGQRLSKAGLTTTTAWQCVHMSSCRFSSSRQSR